MLVTLVPKADLFSVAGDKYKCFNGVRLRQGLKLNRITGVNASSVAPAIENTFVSGRLSIKDFQELNMKELQVL